MIQHRYVEKRPIERDKYYGGSKENVLMTKWCYLGLGVFIQGHNEISYSRSTSKDKKWKPTLDELFHT